MDGAVETFWNVAAWCAGAVMGIGGSFIVLTAVIYTLVGLFGGDWSGGDDEG